MRLQLTLALIAIAHGAGCTVPSGNIVVPAADPTVFRNTIYPILLRDCGFPACHGTSSRFFSVFGPGRTRLDAATPIYDPATPDELALSYTRARSMLLDPEGPRSSLLLRKPISIDEGGAEHAGDDPWGQAVFRTTADQRYMALVEWATKP